MRPRYPQALALALADKVPDAVDRAVAEIAPDPSQREPLFADRLGMRVSSTTLHATASIRG